MVRKIRPAAVIFILILVLGLTLRLFRIGSDGFWIDELGVAKVAHASTLPEVLNIVRSHVMAMPLDYIVTWGMGHVSTSEGWLRLSEVFWGTLTLIAAYALYRDIVSRRTALFGIFILAITPILIRYSQELRFYAPLVFFYTLCTAIGLKAARKNTIGLWITYTLLSVIGVYFHLYVALAFINVALAFVSQASEKNRSLIPITASFLFIFLSAVMTVFQFGKLAGNPSGLFDYENPVQVIGGGFGVVPPFNAPAESYIFGVVILSFTLVGLWCLREQWPLAVSVLAQTLLILALDYWRNYFASARQLLPLLPMITLFTAKGADALLERLSFRDSQGIRRHIPLVLIVLLLFVSALLVLVPYYKAEKTSTEDILTVLKTRWEPGEQIWVAPSYNLDLYAYYAPWLKRDLHPFELDFPKDTLSEATFVLVDPSFDPGQGFEKIYQAPATTFYPQTLWKRP